MVSYAVLLLGPLVCLWAQSRPFSHTQALIGDAAAPVLVIVLALVMIGLRRDSTGTRDDAGFGAQAFVDWIWLADEKPAVVLVLVVAAVLGNGPAWAPNPAIVTIGVAWLSAGACRRARGGSAAFDGQAEWVTGLALVAATWLCVDASGRSPFEPWTSRGAVAWGLVVAVACALLLFRTQAERTRRRRGRVWLSIPALLLLLTPVVLELPVDLDFAVYAGLPLTWLALAVAGRLARALAARRRTVDHAPHARCRRTIAFGRWLHLPTAAWSMILALQLASPAGAAFSHRSAPVYSMLGSQAYAVLVALILLVIGRGLAWLPRREDSARDTAALGFERALMPMLAPVLVLTILHAFPNADRWYSTILPRGQAASLLEALPVPLLGAALVVAFAFDRACGRRPHAAVAALGASVLGLCLLNLRNPLRFEPIMAWFGTPSEIEHAGLRGLYGPVALLVTLAAATTVVRLVRAARGARPSLVVMGVAVAAACVHAAGSSPLDGPVAATWAAIVGCAVWLAVEVALLALSEPRSRVIVG